MYSTENPNRQYKQYCKLTCFMQDTNGQGLVPKIATAIGKKDPIENRWMARCLPWGIKQHSLRCNPSRLLVNHDTTTKRPSTLIHQTKSANPHKFSLRKRIPCY